MGEKVAPKTEGAWIAPSAVVMGDVVLEPACSVWYGAVIGGTQAPSGWAPGRISRITVCSIAATRSN